MKEKFEKVKSLIIDWFGDDFEDGELDGLIFGIVEIFEDLEETK